MYAGVEPRSFAQQAIARPPENPTTLMYVSLPCSSVIMYRYLKQGHRCASSRNIVDTTYDIKKYV